MEALIEKIEVNKDAKMHPEKYDAYTRMKSIALETAKTLKFIESEYNDVDKKVFVDIFCYLVKNFYK